LIDLIFAQHLTVDENGSAVLAQNFSRNGGDDAQQLVGGGVAVGMGEKLPIVR
jgi:hypothetical protein